MEKELNKFLEGQYILVRKVEDEVNKDIHDKLIKNVYQRRELLKHISVISMAILGFSPLVLDKPVYREFFIIGIIMHLFLVFFILSRLREQLDGESNGLQLIKDSWNEIFEEKRNIIEECIEKRFSLAEYQEKIKNSNGHKKTIKEIEKIKNQRENKELDFNFEFIIFIFTTASFFLLIAIINFDFNIYWIIIFILLFFVISFSDFSTLIIKLLSKLSKPIDIPRKIKKLIKRVKQQNEKT